MEKIERDLTLNVDRKTLWDFVSTPVNLNDITPPDLDFRIISDVPKTIYNGLIIVYQINLPIIGRRKWVTEIKHVREGISFVDEQRSGPYGFWYHLHELSDAGVEQSRMRDQVHYLVPFGLLGRSFAGGMVRSRLEEIFNYRSERMKEIFR